MVFRLRWKLGGSLVSLAFENCSGAEDQQHLGVDFSLSSPLPKRAGRPSGHFPTLKGGFPLDRNKDGSYPLGYLIFMIWGEGIL